MLPYGDWLALAERLPVGRSERVPHECGEGSPMIVENASDCWRSWCHRCHEGGYKPKGRQSLDKQIQLMRSKDDELKRSSVRLPFDVSFDMPPQCLLWLSRGGITQHLIRKYRIQYSATFMRCFLPVYMGGDLVYWQARAVHKGQAPKYINPRVNKSILWYEAGSGEGANPDKEVAVVTEDILSAIRVGEIKGHTGISILGTQASTAQLVRISQFKGVKLWFDPDEAGRRATNKIQMQLGIMGRNVSVIRSDNDPKIYTHRELEGILNGAT